ncbi:hypothetical protein FQZ97_739970 [compost metagenome]
MPTNGRRMASSPGPSFTVQPSLSTTFTSTPGEAVLKPEGLMGRITTLDSSAPDTSVPPV